MKRPEIQTFDDIRMLLAKMPDADAKSVELAQARNGTLTKPPGALGRLERLAIWYAGWRKNPRPEITKPQVVVFAGNHGIAAQGVSAFPPEVTEQMVLNFEAGGAAINQLCKISGANMSVVVLNALSPTKDFSQAAAMSEAECVSAFMTGWDAVAPDADLFVAGEMGIANTTSAAAIACAIIGQTPEHWVGRGTGVDDAGLARKASVIGKAIGSYEGQPLGLNVLARFGGYEIAAISGAFLAARFHRIPVILDGFIATAAALTLFQEAPSALDHVVAGHASDEQAHRSLLAHINKEPLLDLGLRLGEGSGGVLAISILKSALACHSGMASFAEAGVSEN